MKQVYEGFLKSKFGVEPKYYQSTPNDVVSRFENDEFEVLCTYHKYPQTILSDSNNLTISYKSEVDHEDYSSIIKFHFTISIY